MLLIAVWRRGVGNSHLVRADVCGKLVEIALAGGVAVQRTSHYVSLMFQRVDTVWTEREPPPLLQADCEHEACDGKLQVAW
jgi:hypothetical protein